IRSSPYSFTHWTSFATPPSGLYSQPSRFGQPDVDEPSDSTVNVPSVSVDATITSLLSRSATFPASSLDKPVTSETVCVCVAGAYDPAACLPSKAACKPVTSLISCVCESGGNVDGLSSTSSHATGPPPPPPPPGASPQAGSPSTRTSTFPSSTPS